MERAVLGDVEVSRLVDAIGADWYRCAAPKGGGNMMRRILAVLVAGLALSATGKVVELPDDWWDSFWERPESEVVHLKGWAGNGMEGYYLDGLTRTIYFPYYPGVLATTGAIAALERVSNETESRSRVPDGVNFYHSRYLREVRAAWDSALAALPKRVHETLMYFYSWAPGNVVVGTGAESWWPCTLEAFELHEGEGLTCIEGGNNTYGRGFFLFLHVGDVHPIPVDGGALLKHLAHSYTKRKSTTASRTPASARATTAPCRTGFTAT